MLLPCQISPARHPPEFQNDFNLTTDQTGVFNSTLSRDISLPVNATVDQLDDIPISEVQSFKEPALPWYSDQALPFEITVSFANEYGAAASAKLFGVEILNEGWGMSIDDAVNEMQATFVACFSKLDVSCSSFVRSTRCAARVGRFATRGNHCQIYPRHGRELPQPQPHTGVPVPTTLDQVFRSCARRRRARITPLRPKTSTRSRGSTTGNYLCSKPLQHSYPEHESRNGTYRRCRTASGGGWLRGTSP